MASTIVVDKLQATGGVVFTLPTADGSAGHLLKTNGSAVLSFVADTDTGIVNVVEDTSPQLGGFLDANGNYIQMQKGGDIASASPTVIDTDGDYFICTGTTSFTAFTVAADRHFFLEFAGVLTMTHGAGTLDLPGGANITTAASDVGEFVSTAADTVTCVNYTKASGKPVKTDFANADINASAAIAQSKLVDIVNADIDASAAIAQSKLVDVVNADISAAAAIDQSKLAGLDGTPDTDHTANGPQTSTLLAGYTTTLMDLVYLHTNGRWEEAASGATGTSINLLGIALEVKDDGEAMNVALPGSFVRDDSWSFSVGVPLYVSGTAGAITTTKPTGSSDVVRTVGYSLSATMIFFDPSPDYVTLA